MVGAAVRDLLLPRTDMGALVQLVIVFVVFPPLIWLAVRRERDVGVFVTGIFVLLLGLMALRTVH